MKSGEDTRRSKPLGRHLLLDLFECDAKTISSLPGVKAGMLEAASRACATVVELVFHEFSPFGVSGVVVIAESHLAIHTWPEYRYAAVDIFTCGDVLEPKVAAEYLAQVFGAAHVSVVQLERGLLSPADVQNGQLVPHGADPRIHGSVEVLNSVRSTRAAPSLGAKISRLGRHHQPPLPRHDDGHDARPT